MNIKHYKYKTFNNLSIIHRTEEYTVCIDYNIISIFSSEEVHCLQHGGCVTLC